MLPCLSAGTEMAAIANSSDSCHAAELDASCLLSDNCISSGFLQKTPRRPPPPRWLLTHLQTHLSLVTVTRLIKISYVAMTVAYLFLTYVTRDGGREKKKSYWLASAGEEGLTQLMCYPSPFTASYISLYFCPLVMPVRL